MIRKSVMTLLALMLLMATAVLAAGDIREDSTGVMFVPRITVHPDGENCELDCMGVGVRKKFFFKVYALGFYMDGTYHNELVAKWKPRAGDIDSLVDEKGFFRDLVTGSYCHQFMMRFVRDVDAGKIRDAFRDGLDENLPNLKRDPELKKAVAAFLAWFQKPLVDGHTLAVTIGKDGTIVATLDKEQLGSMRDPRIARALTAIWLGEDCISDSLREGLVQRFYQ